jgi:hypothetical protein
VADFLTDDDRPPIEVVAGSIRFVHGFRWKEHGTGRRKWKPDHSNGHSVADYDVLIGTLTRGTGETVTIEYTEDGTTYPFTVTRVGNVHSGRYEPLVISEQPMDQDCDGFGISFGNKGSGRITRVAVDGNDLPLSGDGRVKILPQRQRLGPKEVQRLLSVLLARLARLFDEHEKRPRRTGRPDRGRSGGTKPVRRSGKS